jgi:hypothetical protein
MTPTQLQKLLDSADMTQMGAARELDISPRQMRRYIAGEHEIPRVVIFALRWIIANKADPGLAFGEPKRSKRAA